MRRSAEFGEEFSIQSLGAVGDLVTGSLHKLRHGESTIIVDAGLFQGKYEVFLPNGNSRNSEKLKGLKTVDTILLTHAHLDHIGRLPLLYTQEKKPKIITTIMTQTLIPTMLHDAAKIQKQGDKLYNSEDVNRVIKHVKAVDFGKDVKIGNKHDHLGANFIYNGHIPGSASILIQKEGVRGGILFSGDIGREINPICGGWGELAEAKPSDVPVKALWVESTSFDRHSVSFDEKYGLLIGNINQILNRGGSVVLPILSLQRNQEITEMIARAQDRGDIPQDCKIYKDAPLAQKFEELYIDKAELFMTNRFGNDENFYKTLEESQSRFNLKNSLIVLNNKESVKLANMLGMSNQKSIILTGGGMCGFGRVRNYIDGAFGENRNNGVILTCYQVEGTEGREIVEQGRLSNAQNQSGATVIQLDVFSGHVSGESDTFKFLERFNLNELEIVGIIHGSSDNRRRMAEAIKSRGYPARVVLPDIGEVIEFSL